jgi:hypothetical protein
MSGNKLSLFHVLNDRVIELVERGKVGYDFDLNEHIEMC